MGLWGWNKMSFKVQPFCDSSPGYSGLPLSCLMETNHDSTVLFFPAELSCVFIHVVNKFALFFLLLNSFQFLWLGTSLYLPFALLWHLFRLQVSCTIEDVFHYLSPVLAKTHFLDILLAFLAIHKFQNIRPRSLPIFNTMQYTMQTQFHLFPSSNL